MSQWNLIIDVARCENCNNCVLANKDEFVGNNFPGYSAPQPLHGKSTIQIHRTVRGEGHLVDAAYLPTLCNHCDDAPCMKKGGGCISKRADGIVIIDPDKSKGRKDLVEACPYGAIVWNDDLNIPQNWIFDAHLLDKGWKEPRCSQSCPTGAMKAVKASKSEMDAKVLVERLQVLKPELGTRPHVFYKNLHRFTHSFIGGSVVSDVGGTMECVEGAKVELLRAGTTLNTTHTDAFGDFKFDALENDSGTYTVHVHHAALGFAQRTVRLGRTQFLADIELSGAATTA